MNGLRAKEKGEKEARLAKIHLMIRNMLKGNPSEFSYTTFTTADKLFAQHPKIESERKVVFGKYVAELRQHELVCTLPKLF